MLTTFDQLIDRAKSHSGARVAVAAAQDREVLEAVKMALEMGMGKFTLVGDEPQVKTICQELAVDMSSVEFVNEAEPAKAARTAVAEVSSGRANILMKGLVPTADFLRAVLDKEIGLRTGRLLSHVALFRSPRYDRFFYLTDGAMLVAPTLEQKVQVIQNTVEVAHKLGNDNPKVACIAAVEVVNPEMPETLDAAALAKMGDRRQIKGCTIDGPLGLDNAVSEDSARHKGVGGQVAGRADILLAPDIAAGNAIYKTMVYFGDIDSAAIVTGARAPIVLTSRSDSPRARMLSLALAIVTA